MVKKSNAQKKVSKKVVKKAVSSKKIKSVSKVTKSVKKPDQTIAILALVLNILVIPGIGSLVAGKNKEGIWQIVLAILGIPLMLVLIGFPMFLGAWIWGLVTGIRLVQASQ
ncbi:hypothetical protein HOC01_00550 [archaeon]|jgi:TM2 domain-containing membrane protein YozV|nr:hypothetical protein [archaeon]MBT6698670.1 hypothetical protein [archaeon]